MRGTRCPSDEEVWVDHRTAGYDLARNSSDARCRTVPPRYDGWMKLPAHVLAVLVLVPSPALAQDTHRVDVKGVVGTAGFLDSPTDYRPVFGAAARVYISPHFALEPEFLYTRASPQREDYAFQTGIIWQFQRATGVEPYLVAGVGMRHRRFRFPGALQERFTSNAFTVDGGVGARIRVGTRFVITPEIRLGSEPIACATVGLGYAFR